MNNYAILENVSVDDLEFTKKRLEKIKQYNKNMILAWHQKP